MSWTRLAANGIVSDVSQVNQIIDGLTGATTDQPITQVQSQQTVTEAVLVSGVDPKAGTTVFCTLTANRVVGAPLSPVAGQRIHYVFTENGTGGWTLTFNAVFSITNWALNTAANARTELTVEYDATASKWVFASNPANLDAATVWKTGVKVLDDGGWAYNVINPDIGLVAGEADSQPKLATALAAAPVTGRIFLFPSGTFNLLTPGISPQSYTTLLGVGRSSILNDSLGNSNMIGMSDKEGLVVQWLRFTGTGNLGTAGRGAIIAANGASYGTRKSKFIYNFFDGVGTCGIVMSVGQETEIWGNDIRSTKEHGIYCSGATDMAIGPNTIISAGAGSTSGNVDAIKVASSCVRISVLVGSITAPLHEGILVDNTSTDCAFVGGTINSCPNRAVRVVSGSRNDFTGINAQGGTLEAVLVQAGGLNTFTGMNLNCPNAGGYIISAGVTETEILGGNISGTLGAGWAIDNGATDTKMTAIRGATGVGAGIVNRASAVRPRVYFCTGLSVTDQGSTNPIVMDPVNPGGVSAITVTTSPFTYTAGATPEAVYIVAGTVSLIVKNSITIGTGTSATVPITVFLDPGESVVVTYTVAPTMNRDKK